MLLVMKIFVLMVISSKLMDTRWEVNLLGKASQLFVAPSLTPAMDNYICIHLRNVYATVGIQYFNNTVFYQYFINPLTCEENTFKI